jgi:hypothetical protein
MAKYRSRATRLSEAMGVNEEIISNLEDIRDDSDLKDEDKVKKANEEILKVETGEVDDLQGEMESWRDNMSGTNLEATDKYSRVDECAESLSNIASTLQDVGEITEADEIDSVVESLQSAVDEAMDVDFPGMFG